MLFVTLISKFSFPYTFKFSTHPPFYWNAFNSTLVDVFIHFYLCFVEFCSLLKSIIPCDRFYYLINLLFFYSSDARTKFHIHETSSFTSTMIYVIKYFLITFNYILKPGSHPLFFKFTSFIISLPL